MSKHVVVDGSNLATEGRSLPSLQQLNEAVLAYLEEHPTDVITVVVDATFGHRIDAKEVRDFDEAIENNELVSPPAGAIGRGDAFVLQIAKKANAVILSNDSFQEFHGEHEWLFDEGRLVGGKPVPHVGWVFVPRAPVRGMISRRATRVAKRDPKVAARPSVSASQPMPVPKSPPPGRRSPRAEAAPAAAAVAAEPKLSRSQVAANKAAAGPKPAAPAAPKGNPANELMAFLGFVEHNPVGTTLDATFESYSSHGAYAVTADGVHIYVPMRSMASPAPRSAREVVALGEKRSLVIVSFNAARRGIDAALPGFVPAGVVTSPAAASAEPKPTKAAGRKKAAPRGAKPDLEVAVVETPTKPAAKATKKGAAPRKAAPTKRAVESSAAPMPDVSAATPPTPAKVAAKKSARSASPAKKSVPTPAPVASSVPEKPAASKPSAPKKAAPVKKASAKKAASPSASPSVPAKNVPMAKAASPVAPASVPAKAAPAKKAAAKTPATKASAATKPAPTKKAAPKPKPV
jgi:Zc3h12a-like Ribonuclease NYN domain